MTHHGAIVRTLDPTFDESGIIASYAPQPGDDEHEIVTLEFTPKQLEYYYAVYSGKYNYLATGGAIRGTKTFMTLLTLVSLCVDYPGSRWAVVRVDLPTLKRNTIPSFEKIRGATGDGTSGSEWIGPLNQSSWTYTCENGSQIIIFPESVETDPDLDRWKGLEVNGFLLEEANELQFKSFNKAIERAGSWLIGSPKEQRDMLNARLAGDPDWREKGPAQPPPIILLTFNPADNWVREKFYDPYEAGTLKAPYYYLPTTMLDNPFLTDEYRESLKQLPPVEYKRFVLGEWGSIINPNQLIQTSWVVAARSAKFIDGPEKEALDIARYGDDIPCFARIRGNALVELTPLDEGSDVASLRKMAQNRIVEKRISTRNYIIDAIGMGATMWDEMRAANFRVRGFVAGAKPFMRKPDPEVVSIFKFYDLRSQAWYEFAQKLRMGRFRLSVTSPRLVKDLTSVRYEITKDRVLKVESKDDLKLRIGRSTDEGDAVVMAAFDWPDYGEDDESESIGTTSYKTW